MFVYVVDMNGQPLMPTQRFGKVRRLLRDKKAQVVKRCPFTIRLLYEPETKIVQDVVLGVGYGGNGWFCSISRCILTIICRTM